MTSATIKAEAYATEAAVEVLESSGYKILYVGRNADDTTRLVKGPDIVAESPSGQLAVVEVKGGDSKRSNKVVNETLLTSEVDKVPYVQPSFEWLRAGDGERYLPALKASTDPTVSDKVYNGLRDIVLNGKSYEAIVVVSAPKTSWGKVDEASTKIRDSLKPGSDGVQMLRIDQPPLKDRKYSR